MRSKMAATMKQTMETWVVERPSTATGSRSRSPYLGDEVPRRLADVSFTSRTLARDRGMGSIERSGFLTSYAIEGILEDALWMGRGTRVEVRLAPHALPDDVGWLRARLAGLAQRDIDVD